MNTKEFLAKNISFFRYFTDEAKVFIEKRELYAFVEVKTDDFSDSNRLEKIVWDGILSEYKRNERMKASDALRLALKYGEKTLKDVIKKDKNLGKKGVDLSYSLILFSDNKAYISVFGDHVILLSRDEKVLDISDVLKRKSSEIVSTYFYDTDLFVLGTQKNISKISSEEKRLDLSKVYDTGIELIANDDGGMVFFSNTPMENFFINKEDADEKISNKEIEAELEKTEEVRAEIKNEDDIEIKEDEEKVENHYDKSEEAEEIEKENFEEIDEKFANEKLREENINKEVEIKGRQDKTIEKSKKVKQVVKRVFQGIKSFFEKAIEIIGGIITKIISFISEKLGFLMDKKFGRELWYRKLKQRFGNIGLGLRKRNGIEGMRIDGYRTVSKKKKIIGFLLLFVIVIILGYWGYTSTQKQKEIKEAKAVITAILSETDSLIIEAERTTMSDITNSQNKIGEAEKKFAEIESLSLIPEDIKSQIDEMEKKLISTDDKVSRKFPLSEEAKNIELFVVAKLNFQDSTNLEDVAYFKAKNGSEYLFLIDSGTNSVYKISLKNKSITKVSDPANLVKSPLKIRKSSTALYILDSNEGLLKSEIDDTGNNGDIGRVSGLEANKIDIANIKDFEVWSQSRFFSLNTADAKIYMNSLVKGVYANKTERFSSEYVVDGQDLLADEINVYGVFSGSTALKRFKLDKNKNAWVEDSLNLDGVYPVITNLKYGFTSEDNGYVYLFEENSLNPFTQKTEDRIILFTQPDDNGNMIMMKQYVYRGEKADIFSNVKNFVVDTEDTYAFVLDGENVWMIDLTKN